jgi:HAD superfamily hydrolase (TIGR01509 family)
MIPQAILFDMDGTIADSEPLWFAGEAELMAQFDFDWKHENQSKVLGGPIERVGKYMSELANGANTPEFFSKSLIAIVSSSFEEKLALLPGAREILQGAKALGIPIALVSASPRPLVEACDRFLGGNFFDALISCDDVTTTKPDPECYLKAAEVLGVSITNCLVLEDSQPGVTSGKMSGAKVIAIPHLVNIVADDQVKVIKTLAGLKVTDLFNLH